jgi:iron complex outermembrane receptor protein
MKKLHATFASGVSLAALLCSASISHAQTAPTAPAVADPTTQLDEVIVTATRRSERLQDVPGSVSAVSGELLDALKVKTLADFAAFTPGVSFESSSPGSNRIAIRGITTGGNQLNSAIGLYLDDVPLGSSTPFGGGARSTNITVFDLERIEVLNGPQGTLYGANALGGTLRYLTQAPNLSQTSGKIEVEGSQTRHGGDNGAARAMLNVPLLEDRLAVRASVVYQKDDGYVDDPDHGRENLGHSEVTQGRVALRYQASDLLSFQLNGFTQHQESDGYLVAFRDITTHRPVQGDYDQSYPSIQPSEIDLDLVSGVINYDLDWAKFTSITAWQDNKNKTVSDLGVAYSAILSGIFGPAGVAPYILTTDAETKRTTQEFRLTSRDSTTFEWLVGAFYSKEETVNVVQVLNNADPAGKLLGITLGRFDLPSEAEEYAIFVNGTYHFTPQLDASVGVRQSWNSQVFSSTGIGLLVNPAAPATPIVSSSPSDEEIRTYLFNLRYRPSRATTIYGRIASGYRPGGPNLVFGGAGTGNSSFQPDTLWNYEVGLKQTFSEGRGNFNVSAYHIDWSDIQLTVNVGGINQLTNGGDATVDGVESTASYQLLPNLNVMASATWTDAKLDGPSPRLGIAYDGARLPYTPEFSFATAATWDFQATETIAGALNVAYRHIGDRTAGYASSLTSPLYALDAYDIVDLTLTLTSDSGWELSPFVRNVFDEQGEISASTGTNGLFPTAPVPVNLAQPRTFGITLGRSF